MGSFIDCTNNNLTPEQIVAAMLTKNAEGEYGLRVVFIDACATDAVDCSNNSMTPEQGFKASIGLQCGKPALRIALPKGTFLNDISTYANDAAAAVGGLAVGDIYFNSTTSKLHARMS